MSMLKLQTKHKHKLLQVGLVLLLMMTQVEYYFPNFKILGARLIKGRGIKYYVNGCKHKKHKSFQGTEGKICD